MTASYAQVTRKLNQSQSWSTKMEDNMHNWTEQQICEYYDQNPNLLLSTYAGMLGLNVAELKDILFGDWWD